MPERIKSQHRKSSWTCFNWIDLPPKYWDILFLGRVNHSLGMFEHVLFVRVCEFFKEETCSINHISDFISGLTSTQTVTLYRNIYQETLTNNLPTTHRQNMSLCTSKMCILSRTWSENHIMIGIIYFCIKILFFFVCALKIKAWFTIIIHPK